MSERRILNNKKRRHHQLKRNLICCSFTFILALSCAIIFSSSFAKANSTKEQSIKYYTSIQIKAGQTLWTIAEEYMTTPDYKSVQHYINEVIEMNHLKDESIHAGEHLIIPYYSSEFVL